MITTDVDKFTVGGWIEPDFSKGGHEFTIVSKGNSFNLYLLKESFVNDGGKTVIIPNHTLNLELFDGEKWYSVMGNTKLPEDWSHTAFVVDGSKAMLYLDGNLEGEVKLEKELVLAQCKYLLEILKRKPIILFDEVCSHLDKDNRSLLLQLIDSFNVQTLMTGTEKNFFSFLSTKASYCNITVK